MEGKEKDVEGELDRRYTDIFTQGVDRKVREARYNTRYKGLRNDHIPEYLLKYEEEIQIDIITKLRCGNLEDENKYWLGGKGRKCTICKKCEGSLEHLIGECRETARWVEELRGGSRELKVKAMTSGRGDQTACKVISKIEKVREGGKREEVEAKTV
ncbi:hypothetical protein QAD02_003679 [Eretmocerus hayati]|uniref:Uncharacterized protein n=1 Tax=Eretmocerus hayati TaxID=131215 RepID=A0ACC2NSA1_9HYME|nr:hypothetical protein QAD02_003679 [Eretmocerus hayati]